MLDWPAFGEALWRVSDALGIRPEWQLPMIALETAGTFDPSITNRIGCVGLNQFCPRTYKGYVHVPVAEYRQWPASQQLAGPILQFWKDALRFGPIRSSTRLMQAQLGPGSLKQPPALQNVIFRAPTDEYEQNKGLDTAGKKFITVQDLADAMAKRARTPAVRDALAQAYAMRPGERMKDPVFGDDFERITPPVRSRSGPSALLVATTVLALVTVAGVAASEARAAVTR